MSYRKTQLCKERELKEKSERERNELLAYLDADHYANCNAELRRERDEAREALEFRRELFKVQEAQLNENREKLNELQDELAALKRTAHWLFSRLSIYLDGEQFIGTAQRLERIGEENPWLKESYIP